MSNTIDTEWTKMSNSFDITRGSTYREGMFTERVRRAFRAVVQHVDVLPDTLVLRALEVPERATRH